MGVRIDWRGPLKVRVMWSVMLGIDQARRNEGTLLEDADLAHVLGGAERAIVVGSVDIVVKFSPTLRMLPAFERERAIEEASTQAYQRVLEAFEPQREAVA